MFPELHAVLKLDQKDLHGTYVNVLEEAEQSGSFLVHHFLSHSLKSGKSIVFLGLEHSLGHYHAVGMKLGNNLQKAKEAGQIAFIEGLKLTSEAYGKKAVTSTTTSHRRNSVLCHPRIWLIHSRNCISISGRQPAASRPKTPEANL